MLVGIISDTHDNCIAIRKAVAFFNGENCGRVIHAGDFVAPFAMKALHPLTMPMIAVLGNNEGEVDGLRKVLKIGDELQRGPYAFMLGNKRMLLMHEPSHIEDYEASGHYDYILYGHTHEKYFQPGPPAIINPGECCGWITGLSTVGLLDIQTGVFSFHTL
jgi:putative phosphoesterase